MAVARFEKTLKLTPSGVTVAPSGALVPVFGLRLVILLALSPAIASGLECRATISSWFVGITHPALHRGDPRVAPAFASASRSTLSHAQARQMRRRISPEFSPMPAMKTRPSSPPRTAASAPILSARYTK